MTQRSGGLGSRSGAWREGRAALAILLLLFASSAFAQAPKQALEDAEGLQNWSGSIDLGAYAPGKYNVVVEGVDVAGNVTRPTPVNVFVDPDSDLPRVSIVNPYPLMRVGGDLTVVGTCADDDGVARVEVSLDGGEFKAASGAEFWYLFMDTAAIPEGRRTLAIRGVDVNGLSGPETRVSFDLDLTKPLALVENPAPGALISGKRAFAGSVFDANGIRSLEYSIDDRATWERVDLKRSKDPVRAGFSLQLDTAKLADGPLVLWLRSIDGVGSQEISASLVYVDNAKPSIEILRPSPSVAVNGRFVVAGSARDEVGLASLSVSFAGVDSGEVPLVPGNPYFIKELDATGLKGERAELVIVAKDRIGNVSRAELTVLLDPEADLPRIAVLYPAPEGRLRPGELVRGSILDDDGVRALRWSLDGASPVEVPASESWTLRLPDEAASGLRKLSLVPVDANGLAGPPLVIPIAVDKGPGRVRFERVAGAEGSRDYSGGEEFRVDAGEFIEGSIEAPNPLASAELIVAAQAPRALSLAKGATPASSAFRIAVDRSFPFGFAPVSVRARDVFGNEFEGRTLVYISNYAAIREETGFRFADARVAAPGAEPGRMVFGPAIPGGERQPIFGAFHGERLAKIAFEPPSDLVQAELDGAGVRLSPRKDGTTPALTLVGTTERGHVFKAGPYIFQTDSTPPELTIAAPAEGAWLNAQPTISGRIADSGGGLSATWRILPSGAARPLALKPDGTFELKPEAADLGALGISIAVEALDSAGNIGRAVRSFALDSAPPDVRFLAPEPGAIVSGPEEVAALLDDASGIALVEYAADGAAFEAVPHGGRFFVHRADFAANPKAVYRISDRAGNRVLSRPNLTIAAAQVRVPFGSSLSLAGPGDEARIELSGSAGARKLSVQLPALGEAEFAALGSGPPEGRFASRLLLSGSVSLKGLVSNPAPLKAVSIRYGEDAAWLPLLAYKDEKSAKAQAPLSIAVDTLKAAEGPARWDLRLEDFSGALRYAPLYVLVDNTAPTLRLLHPAAGASGGSEPIVLQIEDANGIAQAELRSGAAAPELIEAPASRYLVRVLDPGKEKGGLAAFSALLRDAAGNSARLEHKLSLDLAADAPAIALTLDEGSLASGAIVHAAARDDDGAPSLSIGIDGGAPVSGGPTLALILGDLAPGKHTLIASATDSGGRKTELRRDFAVRGPAPAFVDLRAGDAKSPAPLTHGGALSLGASLVLQGSLRAPNGVAALELSISGGAPLKAVLGKAVASDQPFSVALPSNLRPERLLFELRAKDGAGFETQSRFELYGVWSAGAGVDDATAIRFNDERLVEREGLLRARLEPNASLLGRFNGRPIAKVALEPANPALALSFEGPVLRLQALAESVGVPSTLRVSTVDGDVFSFGPFAVDVDAQAPALDLAAPSEFAWTRGAVRLSGSAQDANGLAQLSASVSGGEPVLLLSAPRPGAAPLAFDQELPLGAVADGPVYIELFARDRSGAETRLVRAINKDTVAPTLVQIVPLPASVVNGTTLVAIEALDAGRLDAAAYRDAPSAPSEVLEGPGAWGRSFDFSRVALPLASGGGFLVRDKAGNEALLSPELLIDAQKDKPVVAIQTPSELEVLRGDFSIAGVAYDDDGLAALLYRFDSGAWTRVPMDGTSFALRVALADTSDNEHAVELKAEDIYGIQGDAVARKYRISKAEPLATFTAPPLEKPSRGAISIAGQASDANGVESLSISVDNRATFNQAQGAESWTYALDTRVLSDGLHAIAVRPVDDYGTEGFHASLLNVDNTPPEARLDLPSDGLVVARNLSLSGHVIDRMGLASVRAEIAPLGSAAPPIMVVDLGSGRVIRRTLDLATLKPGLYTVRLVARDRADNERVASRSFTLSGGDPADSVELLYPLPGSRVSGLLRAHGRAIVEGGSGSVALYAGGVEIGVAETDPLGYFSLELDPERLSDGALVLSARTVSPAGKTLTSRPVDLVWNRLGPWLAIDSHSAGAWLPYRPFLEGRSGYAALAPDPADKKAVEAFKKAAKAKAPELVELSVDNGRSWVEAKGTELWKVRLETQAYAEGELHVLVRARFGDGSEAVEKTTLLLDKTPPEVELEIPLADGRYNERLALAGSASDENGLELVRIGLRKGDKKSYELPAFIQGLYLDGHALGGTLWEVGVGLTFFDDNVKLQGLYGSSPETGPSGESQSFFGTVFGAKLIANIAYLPFGSIFGPDWDWLSASFGLGANFSYFSETQSGPGLLVGAVFGQLEFPKFTLRNSSVLSEYAIYTELQVWVLSSVVSGGFIPRMSFGLRLGVF